MPSSHWRIVKTSIVDLATMKRRNYLITDQPSRGKLGTAAISKTAVAGGRRHRPTAGTLGTVLLSTEEFLNATSQRLRRSFTAQECETYRIEPCPDLEELQGGRGL